MDHSATQQTKLNPVDVHPASALVDVHWLSRHLGAPHVKVLDASWYLPTSSRKPYDEYLESHVSGALFFDIERIVDPDSSLPNTFPGPETFGQKVGDLGISQTDTVVIYDREGILSSPRAWWMFRQFGHARVYILNGGMHAWKQAGLPTERGPVPVSTCQYLAVKPHQVCDKHHVHQHLHKHQILDARSRERFLGTAPEPRPGLPSGHIPNSISMPSSMMMDPQTRQLKPADQIKTVFEGAGVNVTQPIICTCGSGIGACVLLLALYEMGHRDALLYDGSWSEWASDPDMPIVTG